jgi:hypothetical protein
MIHRNSLQASIIGPTNNDCPWLVTYSYFVDICLVTAVGRKYREEGGPIKADSGFVAAHSTQHSSSPFGLGQLHVG